MKKRSLFPPDKPTTRRQPQWASRSEERPSTLTSAPSAFIIPGMNKKDVEKKIIKLRQEIENHNHLYH
ncbi:MAG: hypothetical protein AAF203_06510, partial [Pseudomonadota bacterium]